MGEVDAEESRVELHEVEQASGWPRWSSDPSAQTSSAVVATGKSTIHGCKIEDGPRMRKTPITSPTMSGPALTDTHLTRVL